MLLELVDPLAGQHKVIIRLLRGVVHVLVSCSLFDNRLFYLGPLMPLVEGCNSNYARLSHDGRFKTLLKVATLLSVLSIATVPRPYAYIHIPRANAWNEHCIVRKGIGPQSSPVPGGRAKGEAITCKIGVKPIKSSCN